ncbi:MAG: glycosyltransferase family 2 protein [Ignavibacteriales bacterium]|nr:MAG: glycosyltransferase family 2 protein [Ignavibacteriales bacterium]
MLISVIVPVYNVENYLNECIESIINQTFKNIEIILIDDGSKDGSSAICDSFAVLDERIIVVHQLNSGLSAARNVGLTLAKGDYIAFVDSDDYLNINTLSEANSVIKKYHCDIVFWSRIKEYKNRSVKVPAISTLDESILFEGSKLEILRRRMFGLIKEELKTPTKTDAFISAWGKLYKRDIIFQNNLTFLPTQEVGSEDVFFNIQAFFYAHRIVYLNKYFSHYRMYNPNSLTKHHSNTLYVRLKSLYSYIYGFVLEKNLNEEYETALRNRFSLWIINNCLTITSSRYEASLAKKIGDLNKILNDNLYKECISRLSLRYLPVVWKIFFLFAKNRKPLPLIILTYIYRRLNSLKSSISSIFIFFS